MGQDKEQQGLAGDLGSNLGEAAVKHVGGLGVKVMPQAVVAVFSGEVLAALQRLAAAAGLDMADYLARFALQLQGLPAATGKASRLVNALEQTCICGAPTRRIGVSLCSFCETDECEQSVPQLHYEVTQREAVELLAGSLAAGAEILSVEDGYGRALAIDGETSGGEKE